MVHTGKYSYILNLNSTQHFPIRNYLEKLYVVITSHVLYNHNFIITWVSTYKPLYSQLSKRFFPMGNFTYTIL